MASSQSPDTHTQHSSEPARARAGAELVVMGRIAAPFGIKGWLKLHPYTAAPENLLAYPVWWIGDEKSGWREHHIEQSEIHDRSVVIKLSGCDDRDAAGLYQGRQIAVARAALPAPAANEFYWSDLVGLRVLNVEGEDLGCIARILETGANDVFVVEGDRERLIPFTETVVREVNLDDRVIRVDWGSDY